MAWGRNALPPSCRLTPSPEPARTSPVGRGRFPGFFQKEKGSTGVSRAAYLFTSESVSEGHPDKVCDRISDTVVDAYLAAMPEARVACETLATTNRVVIAGEVRGPEAVLAGIEDLVRNVIRDIG